MAAIAHIILLIATPLDATGQPVTVTLATHTVSPQAGTGLVALGLPEGTIFDGVVTDAGGPFLYDSLDTERGQPREIETVQLGGVTLSAGDLTGDILAYNWTDAEITAYRIDVDAGKMPQDPDISGRVLLYRARTGAPSLSTGSNARTITIPLFSGAMWKRPYRPRRFRGFGAAARFSGGHVIHAPATRYVPGRGEFSLTFRMRATPGTGATSGTILETTPAGIKIESFGNRVVATITGTSGSGSTEAQANIGVNLEDWATFVLTVTPFAASLAEAIDGDQIGWPNTVIAVGPFGDIGGSQTAMTVGDNAALSDPLTGDLDEVYFIGRELSLLATVWEGSRTDPDYFGVFDFNTGAAAFSFDASVVPGGGNYLDPRPGNAATAGPAAITGADYSATVVAWFPVAVVGHSFLRQTDVALGSARGFQMFRETRDRILFRVLDGSGATKDIRHTFPASEDLTYPHRYTFTVNRTTDVMTAYVNGAAVGTVSLAGFGSVVSTGNVLLGGDLSTTVGPAGISDAALYGRAIGPAEVSAISRGKSVTRVPRGLIHYWALTQSAGATAPDTIGGLTATLQGSATWRTNTGAITGLGAGFDWIGSGEGRPEQRGTVQQEVRGTRTAAHGDLIDPQRVVFQVSALGCDDVLPVVAGARSGLSEVAIPAGQDVYAVSLAAGQFAADRSGPTIVRLGFDPAGDVGFDVTGGAGLYEPGEIMRSIIEGAGLTFADVFDEDAYDAASGERVDPIGHVLTGEISLDEPCSSILSTMRAYLATDPATSLLSLYLSDDEISPTVDLVADDVDLSTLAVGGLQSVPESSVVASYDPRDVTWGYADTSLSLAIEEREDAERSERTTSPVTAVDPIAVALGTDRRWETLWADESGARDAVERRVLTTGRQPCVVSLRVMRRRDAIKTGVDVTLDLTVDGQV